MFWLIIGAIWLYCAARVLAFVVSLGWATTGWALGLMWPGVLWAAGGKQQEPQQQQPLDSWGMLNAQAGEHQPAAGYAGDTQRGVAGDVYRDGDGEPVPGWVRKPGVTIDG